MFERLRAHFSEAQIVELTWRIALCGAFNRFNDVLQVEVVEEPSLSGSVPSIGSN
jgi:alkylhydroperoxidase family enzyme